MIEINFKIHIASTNPHFVNNVEAYCNQKLGISMDKISDRNSFEDGGWPCDNDLVITHKTDESIPKDVCFIPKCNNVVYLEIKDDYEKSPGIVSYEPIKQVLNKLAG